MQSSIKDAVTNVRGGLAGILIYLAITAAVYFAAFMAAFGNDTPGARLILEFAGIYFMVAHPLWTVPVAYFLGGCFLFARHSGSGRDTGE
ncbi:MAG: hypothetical protein GKC05_07160 [Methanomicrobiales archaeon]|nr:hypothetical protein [Methanomicrobiales archaeon]NYT20245.1 hypothetical protein [Methanomicrobiales archaeon]